MTTENESSAKRGYRKRRRAESEAATRQRITEAAMELHGSVGPARTTISAVAERAGVQRATVYRHFPDEETLFAACSAHWYALRPPPRAEPWSEIRDPDERLETALSELYDWYGWAEPMLVNTLRDAPLVPAMAPAAAQFAAHFESLQGVLVRGRPERGRRRERVAGSIAHALAFTTWRSLRHDGSLSDAEAVELMLATVAAAGRIG